MVRVGSHIQIVARAQPFPGWWALGRPMVVVVVYFILVEITCQQVLGEGFSPQSQSEDDSLPVNESREGRWCVVAMLICR